MTAATVLESAPPTDRPLVYVALGDSATAGVGDARSDGQLRGWSRMLAAAMVEAGHDVDHHVLAREGARTADVLREQLEPALFLRPDVVTLLVGGNDVLRGDFSASSIEQDLERIVDRLRRTGALVLLLRLHDPTRVVPMPGSLARVMRRRVAAVNVVIDAVASRASIPVIDPSVDEACYDRSAWHVDRMHPSTYGHLKLAGLVATGLALAGLAVTTPCVEPPDPIGVRHQAAWMLRNGVPWALKRSVDLLPTLTVLTLREALRPS